MKAIVIREFGGPEVLRLEEVETPRPGPGEALVRVGAVSVNRTFDLLVRQGGDSRAAPLPLVLGADPVGTVEELAPGTGGLTVGQRVALSGLVRCGTCQECRGGRPGNCQNSQIVGVHRWGGYAEYVCLPATALQPIPDELGFPDACVTFRHAPTAFNQLLERAELKAGEWVLVMGAAGALGNFEVQIAKLSGCSVIAAAGTDERASWAASFGADHAINYRAQDLAEEVMRLTGGRGVDVVCENIADPTLWPGAFNSLAPNGRLVTIGAHGGGTVPLDVRRLYLRRLRIIGGARPRPEDISHALEAAASGQIRPAIDRVLPLSQAAEAHRLVEGGATLGKVVLNPTEL